MTNPIPGSTVGTRFGVRGGSWSCDDNGSGGIHTGLDLPAARGTQIYAPIAGTIRHRSYGSAFGPNQFAISPSAGMPFADGEVFLAHTISRLPDGTEVAIGDPIANVGDEGNAHGYHLHLEYMPSSKGQWHCGIHADPQEILDFGGGDYPQYPEPTSGLVYLDRLRFGTRESDSVWYLQRALNSHHLDGGATLPLTGTYGDLTDAEVIKCQAQHGFGSDAPGTSFVGASQAAHLGLTVL